MPASNDCVLTQTLENNRAVHDFYPTPPPVTEALVRTVNLPPLCFEPMSGNSAIAKVLSKHRVECTESDIQWDMGDTPKDATDESFWSYYQGLHLDSGVDYWGTVTNPSFAVAEKVLPLAFEYSPWGVAFLLRLSYQEATSGRAEWLKTYSDHLRYQITINPRVKFRTDKSGTDSITCAWLVWQKSWSWAQMGINCPFQYLTDWR